MLQFLLMIYNFLIILAAGWVTLRVTVNSDRRPKPPKLIEPLSEDGHFTTQ